MSAAPKDQSIVDTLAALRDRLGEALVAVDHWDGDPMSTGVEGHGNPGQLVYVSTFGLAPGRYYVDLEFPPAPGSELPYEQGESFHDVEFEGLASIVQRHLNLSSGNSAE